MRALAAACAGGGLVVALPAVTGAQDTAVIRRASVLEQVLVTASTLGTPFASVSEPRAWGFEACVSS
jgi:hypothetical protein